ncbi:glycine dehydrogenase (aminomethyl-transferring) [Virgibacillus profundi]|uniref:Probable glycine dehydrogenase (decarboxylating) subunit 1 n=1 Tax=Virgibacillus profundi TaxID=2024555 RepID=A0A2A2IDD4_9BACI|nr:aminomethyl-transferring glycine dehydrogenase subunit GcvPA [Virgibacillus profundi]PAV29083.1 glycine dehydrogenase (aminomethyl-transferring) [Virgibacillus profundi]PXY53252.1 aminomethyl-transferring glycine dehydrogenase subunit GcvPA [Virgibacillus profundi]
MEFRYLPMTETDKKEMLDKIGISSTEELFSDIPKEVRLDRELNLKKPASEYELKKELTEMASKNANLTEYRSFLGAGVYDHFIPSVVDHVISRQEFYTSYTPYQPEMTQGELQAMFEFQTMISEITGMPIVNSSLYDGGTAVVEAVYLSVVQTKKKKILVSAALHPEYRQLVYTASKGKGLEIVEIGHKDGQTDLEQLEKELDEDTASVIVQYPNFLGQIEPLEKINELIKKQPKTMFIVSSNPLSLGYLTPPSEFGADIVVGDTQVFGIPAQLGGPHCGYFATTQKLMRKVPGRFVGETVDEEGERGFVLALQTREQHIRREKATSNITSNQALNAVASSAAMSALGKHGVKDMAKLNMQKARYTKKQLEEVNLPAAFSGSFFNEFVVKLSKPVSEVNEKLFEKGFVGGFDLGRTYPELENHMLIATTEIRSKEEIDAFVKEMGDING